MAAADDGEPGEPDRTDPGRVHGDYRTAHDSLGPSAPSAASITPVTPTKWGTGPAAAIARRMAAALTATSDEIAVVHQVLGSATGTEALTSWIYRDGVRSQVFRGGKLTAEDLSTSTPTGHDQQRDITVQVLYPERQVSRQDLVSPYSKPWGNPLPTPAQVCDAAADAAAIGSDPLQQWSGWGQTGEGVTEAVVVRDLLACPHITVAITPNQRFNGTAAIEIVWAHPRWHTTDTFWLNQSTYALMGLTVAPDPGYQVHRLAPVLKPPTTPVVSGTRPAASAVPASTGSTLLASNSLPMTWLPPTKANLALLTVPVPPGFSHATPPGLAIGVPMPGNN